LAGQWLIATPDVIPGGRIERAIDLRFLQLASDIRSNRRDTQLLSVATRKHDLCESGFPSLLSPEKKQLYQIALFGRSEFLGHWVIA
jgi:hypothetical protein